MPLLALELVGLLALVRARPGASPWWGFLAGLGVGPAFLIKGFMVAVPLVAIAPFVVLQRRHLLLRPALWLGLALGWLPVLAWLGLSLQAFGPEVVGGLVGKLLYLSHSDVYSGGPFYYLLEHSGQHGPLGSAGLGGLVAGLAQQGARGGAGRERRLVLLVYPLLLLVVLSAFRTKTPYYGLQLTPMLAILAAQVLQGWSQGGRGPAPLAGLGSSRLWRCAGGGGAGAAGSRGAPGGSPAARSGPAAGGLRPYGSWRPWPWGAPGR
jgi:4-amino-4-deoxy-L-arabinose transferase-like glycosyltransferase